MAGSSMARFLMGEMPTRMTPPTDQYVANTYLSSYSVHLSKYMRSQDRCPIVMPITFNILVGFECLQPDLGAFEANFNHNRLVAFHTFRSSFRRFRAKATPQTIAALNQLPCTNIRPVIKRA